MALIHPPCSSHPGHGEDHWQGLFHSLTLPHRRGLFLFETMVKVEIIPLPRLLQHLSSKQLSPGALTCLFLFRLVSNPEVLVYRGWKGQWNGEFLVGVSALPPQHGIKCWQPFLLSQLGRSDSISSPHPYFSISTNWVFLEVPFQQKSSLWAAWSRAKAGLNDLPILRVNWVLSGSWAGSGRRSASWAGRFFPSWCAFGTHYHSVSMWKCKG